ncbi:MAG: MBL fold metallo-hydrolase [Burkholderiaceae bacterium]
MWQSKYPKPKTPVELLKQGCERPWEVAVKPFRLAPHVYYVGNSWVGGFLIKTREGLILVDTTMHHQVYLIFESIRQLGFDPKDIKIILITHAHYDHLGAVRPIAEYSGAKVYMAKEDEFFITERPELIFANGLTFAPFEVDEYLADDKPVTLGEITIQTVHSPGHTPGATSLFFDDRDDAGNTYRVGLHGGVGLGTVTDRYYELTGLPPSLRDDYLNGLLRLRDREVDIALASHPDHIGMLDRADMEGDSFSAFCDPSAWGRFIDERVRLLKEMMGAN